MSERPVLTISRDSLTTVRCPALITALSANRLDDTFPAGLFHRGRDLLDLLLRHNAIARRNHHLFVPLAIDTVRVRHQSLFALTGTRQANLLTLDHVFRFCDLLLVGHDLAGSLQVTAAATGAGMHTHAATALRRQSHPEKQRDRDSFHDDLWPVYWCSDLR